MINRPPQTSITLCGITFIVGQWLFGKENENIFVCAELISLFGVIKLVHGHVCILSSSSNVQAKFNIALITLLDS